MQVVVRQGTIRAMAVGGHGYVVKRHSKGLATYELSDLNGYITAMRKCYMAVIDAEEKALGARK